MTTRTVEASQQTYARAAGFLSLIIIITAVFASFYVRDNLIVWGNAAETANNIMASEQLFRLGFAADLIAFLCDVLLSVLFYLLLKPVNNTLALIAAFFRLAMNAILGINLLNHFNVLLLLSGADYLTVIDTDQLHALVMLFLNAHAYGSLIGLIFFSPHVFLIGYLFFKSRYIPRILGVLLIIASFSYLLGSLGIILFPNYATIISPGFLLPAAVAEWSLCLWLLFKGVNTQHWDNRSQ